MVLIEKKKGRLVLKAELEEKQREQERKHEMQVQAMMSNYLQQLQYTNAGIHNPLLYGSSTKPITSPPTNEMLSYLPFHNLPDDTN